MQLTVITCIFIPLVIGIIFYIWLISVILAAVNIITTYFRALRLAKGILKKKTQIILLGLLGSYLFLILREFIKPEYICNGLVCIFAIVLYKGLKIPTPEIKKGEMSGKKMRMIEQLGINFKRPARITEDEISVAKEKNICLVCKGELSRLNFICPECKAMYCVRCSEALANLENACWACNSPIDPSKPLKIEKPTEIVPSVEGDSDSHKAKHKAG